MRAINWELVPESEELLLLTAEDVRPGETLMLADFRDTHALFYGAIGRWLGLSRSGVRLGTGPIRMRDGLWLCREDVAGALSMPDHVPDLSRMALKIIE